ncbi:Cytochrome P450 3A4, partial [Orchesella cincta]
MGLFGSYVGRTPHLFITDPELIRLIFVKDFSTHFGDRQDFEFGCQIMNELFEFKKGEEWKTLRTFLSPLFTTSKIKQMSEVIADSAQEFTNDLRSECGENGRVKIDCRRRFTTCLIDMFARTTIGVRVEDSKNPDNNFAQAFRAMMFEDMEQNWLFSLSLSFPILQKIAPTFMDEPTKLLASTFRNVIKNRIESGTSSTKDFLDLLCDLWKRVEAGEFKELGFTETTVLAQCVLFFLGGYETTASMLSSFLWNIANHPEVQDKMNKELEQALSNNPNIDHELISESNIPYISACINETLRLQPSFYRPERICGKDWNHNGVSIKKGTVVMIPTWAANRNPKYFPDEPEKFKPERFLPENKGNNEPYAFTSFGFGPRSCIGVRFAYEKSLCPYSEVGRQCRAAYGNSSKWDATRGSQRDAVDDVDGGVEVDEGSSLFGDFLAVVDDDDSVTESVYLRWQQNLKLMLFAFLLSSFILSQEAFVFDDPDDPVFSLAEIRLKCIGTCRYGHLQLWETYHTAASRKCIPAESRGNLDQDWKCNSCFTAITQLSQEEDQFRWIPCDICKIRIKLKKLPTTTTDEEEKWTCKYCSAEQCKTEELWSTELPFQEDSITDESTTFNTTTNGDSQYKF